MRPISFGAVSAGALVLLIGTTDVRAAEGQNIEEVIVTAQKRAEALIDVPQSVSVVDGGVLERHQASSFQDYLKLVPGLQLSQTTPGSRASRHARRQHRRRRLDGRRVRR